MGARSVVCAIAMLVMQPWLSVSAAHAQDVQEGIVETRILDFDPQSGMKSQHLYFINFTDRTVNASVTTGSTSINLGVVQFDVGSIRDNFVVSDVTFNDSRVTFLLSGTTASGTGVTPDIDYRLKFVVTRNGKASVTGCHDGYPAYLVQHNGREIYRFNHKSLDLLSLFGTCDVVVAAD